MKVEFYKIDRIEDDQIKEIEEKIGYTFKEKEFLFAAFRRKSYTEEHKQGSGIPNNEVLEYYGDSALNLIVVKATAPEALKDYSNGFAPFHTEAELTNFVSNYTDKTYLSGIMESLDIAKYLVTSKGDQEKEVWKSPSVMEDLFEAIVGAMWFDNDLNIDAIYDNVISLLDLHIDEMEFYEKNEYVQLKEFIDRNPDYKLIKPNGYYELWYKDQLVTYGLNFNGLDPKTRVSRYKNMIMNAHFFIETLKDMKVWDVPDFIPTEGVTPENAINKLQELYQQKKIYLNPIYNNDHFDRERNLWLVDCVFPDDKYPTTFTGEGKTKTEAKKQAAYKMYMDIAEMENK